MYFQINWMNKKYQLGYQLRQLVYQTSYWWTCLRRTPSCPRWKSTSSGLRCQMCWMNGCGWGGGIFWHPVCGIHHGEMMAGEEMWSHRFWWAAAPRNGQCFHRLHVCWALTEAAAMFEHRDPLAVWVRPCPAPLRTWTCIVIAMSDVGWLSNIRQELAINLGHFDWRDVPGQVLKICWKQKPYWFWKFSNAKKACLPDSISLESFCLSWMF